MWSYLPGDLIREVLSYALTPKTVWSATRVDTHWRASIDHPSTWQSLCTHAGWEVPPSAAEEGGSAVRAFFIQRYRTHRLYARGYWTRRSWSGHSAGIVAICVPPAKRLYSWAEGEYRSLDENLLVSAAGAPTFGIKTWQLDGGNGNGNATATIDCLSEQHVYRNPLLASAAADAVARMAPGGMLDAASSNLKVHWTCVDIFTTPTDDLGPSANDAVCGSPPPSGSFNANSASSSRCSPAPAPPASNFLLFGYTDDAPGMPLIYLYDLHCKKLRAFKPGHESAITCVRMGRAFPARSLAGPQRHAPTYRTRLAASGGYDHAVCVWDIDSGALVARTRGGCVHTVWCVDLNLPRRLVAAGADDGQIRIFKLHPSEAEEEEDDESDLNPRQVAARRRERKMREMRDLLARIEAETAALKLEADAAARADAEAAEPERPSRYANDPRFQGPPEDEAAMAAATAAATAAALAEAQQQAPVEPSDPDTGGRLVCTLIGHTRSPMALQFDPFAPDSRLWSAGYDRAIRCWDITAASKWKRSAPPAECPCIRILEGHASVVFSLSITSHVVVSTSRDGTVRVWDKDRGALLRELEATGGNSSGPMGSNGMADGDSGLVSAIASNSASSESSSLTSRRAQTQELKCVTLTARGDIVAAASDGRLAIFEFERAGGAPAPTIGGTTLRRASSHTTNRDQQDPPCVVM